MQNRVIATVGVVALLIIIYFGKDHFINSDYSKITIKNPNGDDTYLKIPNTRLTPVYLSSKSKVAKRVYIGLGEFDHRRWNPKYTVFLLSNGNRPSIWEKAIPERMARKKKTTEVESNFKGYKKYINAQDVNVTKFILVGENNAGRPVYLQCTQGYPEKLKKCTYFGIYNENLAYELSFPGSELERLETLIDFANKNISSFIVAE